MPEVKVWTYDGKDGYIWYMPFEAMAEDERHSPWHLVPISTTEWDVIRVMGAHVGQIYEIAKPELTSDRRPP